MMEKTPSSVSMGRRRGEMMWMPEKARGSGEWRVASLKKEQQPLRRQVLVWPRDRRGGRGVGGGCRRGGGGKFCGIGRLGWREHDFRRGIGAWRGRRWC